MQVRELESIEALHSFQLLSGEGGLSNPMKDVVLLEYESLKQKTPEYYQEDFIVSTLFYAKDDPTLLLPVVERLIDLGASGLAFKSVYYTALPDAVLELSRDRNFPIFIFNDLYMEDVILSISDYIRQRHEFSQFEEPLCGILSENYSTGDIQQLCSRMNPGRQKYMCAVYIHASSPESTWSVSMQNVLRMRAARSLAADYRFMQFRRGFFAIYNATQRPVPLAVAAQCRELLQSLGCLEEGLCFGVSNVHEHTEDFHCVIREAFDALVASMAFVQPQTAFSELGIYHMIFPMLRDKSARQSNYALMDRLAEYDRVSSGILTSTLKTYARCGYDVQKAAEVMGQHSNTIRYRLKKIADLIGASQNAGEAMFLLGEFLRLDALWQMIF